MERKRILIVGGSYFYGRVLVEELARRDRFEVYVLNRGRFPLQRDGVHELVCDRRDGEQLARVLPQLEWHAVVDFCAYTPGDVEKLFRVLSLQPGAHYLYISTASVHQDSPSLPITENHPTLTGPQPELGPQAAFYAYNKWLTEQRVDQLCRDTGMVRTVLRPAIIYGQYNYAPRERVLFEQVMAGQPIAVPAGIPALFSCVSVWDAVALLIACLELERAHGNTFLLAGEELISYPLLVDVLRRITGKRVPTRVLPLEDIERSGQVLPFPPDRHLLYSGRRAEAVTGHRCESFESGMARTWKCFCKETA